jgi:Fe-S cluster assembly iron-binding protein IscA
VRRFHHEGPLGRVAFVEFVLEVPVGVSDYVLQFEASPLDDTFESEGVELVVDPLSSQFLDGTTIDYVEGDAGASCKFDNPNVR